MRWRGYFEELPRHETRIQSSTSLRMRFFPRLLRRVSFKRSGPNDCWCGCLALTVVGCVGRDGAAALPVPERLIDPLLFFFRGVAMTGPKLHRVHVSKGFFSASLATQIFEGWSGYWVGKVWRFCYFLNMSRSLRSLSASLRTSSCSLNSTGLGVGTISEFI
jgi:hypothetical protein